MTDKDEYIYHNRLVDLENFEKQYGGIRDKRKYKEFLGKLIEEVSELERRTSGEKLRDFVKYTFYEISGAFKEFDWAVYRNIQ